MQNYNSDLIQVLWVEDSLKAIESYPQEAETFGLELVSYPCWDDAKEELDNDFNRWSAIILDAKCKYHRDSADNAIVFLREALKDISVMCEKKGRIIPWYVLTGGDENEISDSINDERLQWDADWTNSKNKKYYSKNLDNEELYRRIRYHANVSPSTQIHKLYKSVFNALEECGINDEGYNALEDLLVPIHFPEANNTLNYNDKFVNARKLLEHIFRSMSTHGLLPEWGKKVNFRWSCCLLSGMNATRKDKEGEIIYIESVCPILPPVLRKVIREFDIIPAFCHTDNKEDDDIKGEEYLKSVNNSTFLLKSISLQLCDLILWYNNYLKEHPNKTDNANNWRITEKFRLKA